MKKKKAKLDKYAALEVFLKDWEFQDGFREAADQILKKVLSERLKVVFGKNGATLEAFCWPGSDLSKHVLEASFSINEYDSFLTARWSFVEILGDMMLCLETPEQCVELAEKFKSLADELVKRAERKAG